MKRILILANNCLSDTNANGRTLANMLVGYPKECIAQFALRADNPNFDCCENYFCVSDSEALRAFVKGARVGRRLEKQEGRTAEASAERKRARTALTMLLRNLVWNSGCWKKGGFLAFIENFSPEVLLLQAGDCAFLFRLARRLAKEYHIPLVIYNSEGYYFKDYDYFRAQGLAHLCYPLFRRQLCRQFRKTMRAASYAVYNCTALQKAYAAAFSTPSEVIYTATQMQPCAAPSENHPPRISYYGNLGVGRHETLLAVAKTLRELTDDCCIDVYGKAPSEEIGQALKACPQIRFHGFVSYAQVREGMHGSDILLHVESFDSFYREDSKYAFSTKIADSLACGTCFLLFAPSEFACAQYLRENKAAYVVSDLSALKETLDRLLHSPDERKRYVRNALRLAEKNHSARANAARFAEILNNAETEDKT